MTVTKVIHELISMTNFVKRDQYTEYGTRTGAEVLSTDTIKIKQYCSILHEDTYNNTNHNSLLTSC